MTILTAIINVGNLKEARSMNNFVFNKTNMLILNFCISQRSKVWICIMCPIQYNFNLTHDFLQFTSLIPRKPKQRLPGVLRVIYVLFLA